MKLAEEKNLAGCCGLYCVLCPKCATIQDFAPKANIDSKVRHQAR